MESTAPRLYCAVSEMQVKALYSLRVVENFQVSKECWLLKLKTPEISHQAKPGQFLMIRVSPYLDPLLPRPFSLCQISPEENDVAVVYKMSGPGTSWLAGRKRQDLLPVLGPLGQPFRCPPQAKTIVLVGGGIGVTPLISLGEHAKKLGKQIFFFLGLKTRQALPVPQTMLSFVPKNHRTISTDDGSLGLQGDILFHLKKFLAKNRVDYLAACGPKPMLQALQGLVAAERIQAEVAVEQSMACGLGYCQGCAVLVQENGRIKSILACKDGSVISLNKLVIQKNY